MLDSSKYSLLAIKSFAFEIGAFYGSHVGLALGTGLIYDQVRLPYFDEEQNVFHTVESMAYVITHECDIDDGNDRIFSDYLLVCPIIKFEEWAEELAASKSESDLGQIVPELSSNKINRAFYLPPNAPSLPFGGILYLNQICSTHRGLFRSGHSFPVCALSEYAQQRFDWKLQSHLFRMKDDALPRLR